MAITDSLAPWINDIALGERVSPLRRTVVGGARGRVLEIGVGTGMNLRHYDADSEVVGVEPSEPMRRRALRRAGELAGDRSIRVLDLSAQTLPFDAASFDTIVSTFVLCSVEDLDATLRELRRVLKPGGTFRLVEHVRSARSSVARWQDRLQPVWGSLLGGCHLNRDIRETLARAGFDVRGVDAIDLALPSIAKAGIIGVATR